uniref:c-Myc-binding protein n=1 Tax=Lygus hesperus TaxID=30085 RepID=A0A0A9VYL7_LYGHE
MATYRPIDSKREEFRKYLERAGIMDALTKVLVQLYEEPDKPEDALDYLRVNLGDKRPTLQEVEQMKSDIEKMTERIKELELENMKLKGEVPPDTEGTQEAPDSTVGGTGPAAPPV